MKYATGHLAALCLVASAMASAPAKAESFPVKFTGHSSSILKGHTKVAIPTYHVNFITSQQATAVSTFTARTRLAMVLSGVDEATMRRLTEAAYADLRAQFEAAGIALVSEADTQAMVTASGLPRVPGNLYRAGGGSGITIGKSLRRGHVTFAPEAAPVMAAYTTIDSPIASFTGGGGKMNKPANALDATVIVPSLTLDFAQMSASTGSDFLGRSTASAEGSVGFSILASSSVSMLNPNAIIATPGAMRPERDMLAKTEFAKREEGGAAVNTSATLGAISDENYQTVQRARGDAVVVDPAIWESLVRDAYRDYNAAIVSEVKKARG